ncbi:MAG: 1-acyl-sn-glycerol-3-phosphate acyltransferase, partial [Methylococcus sp.]
PEPDFPRSATRKVRKELVLRSLSERPHQEPEPAGLTTATPLKRLMAEVTGVPVNGILDDLPVLTGLGIDSMLRIELVARLEERLGICLEEASITPELTVGGLEVLARNTAGIPLAGERPSRWSRSAWAEHLRPWAVAVLLQSWVPIFCRLRVEGLEHLRGLAEPRIYLANHRSYLDSVAFALALPPAQRNRLCIAAATSVLYRRYAWAVPLAELTLNAFPMPTELDENIQQGFDTIGHRLDEGQSVLLFPEGQMNRGVRPLLPLKGGTGVIAVEMQTPIVPVAIRGTERILPPGVILPRRRGIVTVSFGKPVAWGPDDAYTAATNTIREAMERLLQD